MIIKIINIIIIKGSDHITECRGSQPRVHLVGISRPSVHPGVPPPTKSPVPQLANKSTLKAHLEIFMPRKGRTRLWTMSHAHFSCARPPMNGENSLRQKRGYCCTLKGAESTYQARWVWGSYFVNWERRNSHWMDHFSTKEEIIITEVRCNHCM